MELEKLHMMFFPYMAGGHITPMTDMAKLFAMRGVKCTIIVTSLDVAAVSLSINQPQKLGFDIDIVIMELRLKEVGLPEDFKFQHLITSPNGMEMRLKFLTAVRMLEQPLEKLLEEVRPDCLVADVFLPWTTPIATKLGVPQLVFHGSGYFALAISHIMASDRPFEAVSDDYEPFLIPNFPGNITMTRAKVPNFVKEQVELTKFHREMKESEASSYGVIVNSFQELEEAYAQHYKNVLGIRCWGIGPVSLCDHIIRGRDQLTDGRMISCSSLIEWLDTKQPNSVVYLCFGSTTNFNAQQLHQIAVGLEASGHQFVWVIKKGGGSTAQAEEEWLPQGLREKGRIVRGWAPQVFILAHKAVGSFVTHCGWNSILEGILAGVNLVAWPVAAEQFYNETLLVEVLKIGVSVGAKKWVRLLGDEVKSEMLAKAVKRVMVGPEAVQMRNRSTELTEIAKKAIEGGGSSYNNLTSLLDELQTKKAHHHPIV